MSHGLAPRPVLATDELAALVAVAEEFLSSASAVVATDAVPVWRFSGRWFNAGPYSNRRPHPLN